MKLFKKSEIQTVTTEDITPNVNEETVEEIIEPEPEVVTEDNDPPFNPIPERDRKLIDIILNHEGGFSSGANGDLGGFTYRGISGVLPSLPGQQPLSSGR